MNIYIDFIHWLDPNERNGFRVANCCKSDMQRNLCEKTIRQSGLKCEVVSHERYTKHDF